MGLLLQAQGDRLHLVYDRGDNATLRLTIRDFAGNLLDVSGWSFKLTCKASIDDPLASAIFQLSTPVNLGIDAASAGAQGVVDCKLGPALVGYIAGDYIYDVEGTDGAGLVYTIIPTSRFFARKDTSTPGSVPAPPSVGVPFPDWIALPTFLYMKDAVTGHWVKNRMANNSLEYVSESANPPPF